MAWLGRVRYWRLWCVLSVIGGDLGRLHLDNSLTRLQVAEQADERARRRRSGARRRRLVHSFAARVNIRMCLKWFGAHLHLHMLLVLVRGVLLLLLLLMVHDVDEAVGGFGTTTSCR